MDFKKLTEDFQAAVSEAQTARIKMEAAQKDAAAAEAAYNASADKARSLGNKVQEIMNQIMPVPGRKLTV